MSAPPKLAGFALVLALIFAGATVAGGALGPERDGEAAAARESGHSGSDASHGGETAAEKDAMSTDTDKTAADPVRGLAVSANGLELDLEQAELQRDRRTELRFHIVASDGQAVREFEVEHEKRMHLIVVRRDGQGFQHLHPELGDDGEWRVRLNLPDTGSYRVFADFKYRGEAQTLAADLAVDGAADYRPLEAPATSADTGDGYRARLDARGLRAGREAELGFTVSRDGKPIRTQQYLGAGGHLVALREGDLAYLHVHPEGHGETVRFMTEFPSEGRYRLYLQFKHEGRVRTAEFTQEVTR